MGKSIFPSSSLRLKSVKQEKPHLQYTTKRKLEKLTSGLLIYFLAASKAGLLGANRVEKSRILSHAACSFITKHAKARKIPVTGPSLELLRMRLMSINPSAVVNLLSRWSQSDWATVEKYFRKEQIKFLNQHLSSQDSQQESNNVFNKQQFK